jgi:hypothetical protein
VKLGRCSRSVRVLVVTAAWMLSAMTLGVWSDCVCAQSEEPIAYTGHGAFFDRNGNQIPLTQTFVNKAQAWYREDMLSALNASQKRDFAALERKLYEGVPARRQARLIARQRALDWLFVNSPRHMGDDRLLGKLRALQFALTQPLPR